MRDDDDWTGTPPEGRHPRSAADPAHWRRQWQGGIAGAIIFVGVIVVLIVAL